MTISLAEVEELTEKIIGCAGGYPAGLLMNFNSTTLKAGLRRLDHPDRYVRKTP